MRGHGENQLDWRCVSSTMRPECICRALLDDQENLLLDDARTLRAFETNDIICVQGEPAPALVIALDGWLLLEAALDDGRKAVIEIAPPGTILCLHQADVSPSIYSVVAATPGVACITRAGRNLALRDASSLYEKMLIREGERCRLRLADRVLTVTTRGARNALVRLLMEIFVRATGRYPPASDATLPLPLTQTHLAEALGHTPVYVNRLLRELREMDVVAVRRGELVIIDGPVFKRLAGDAEAMLDAWGGAFGEGRAKSSGSPARRTVAGVQVI